MNDKLLVRLMDYNNENVMISSFWTTNWSEVLKMFSFLKENELPYDIYVENIDSNKYDDNVFFVKDISLHFAGKETVNSLDIYVEVC